MKTITIQMIIDINEQLKKTNSSFKLHLNDACGSPSMTIVPIQDPKAKPSESFIEIVNSYFEKFGISLEYSDDKTYCWVT
ncbi:MAG: hypothetical protein K0R90_1135 [Oscillospiraceae bacterium]|nr:hypothetical protein [Oscillospiraceae bacterium]